MRSFVRVGAPASIANFGPGFDTFGLALKEPRDIVELSLDVYETEVETVPDYSIPTKKNAAYAAATAIAWKNRSAVPFHMKIIKGVRPGSGIGSSAASSVGAALAMAEVMEVKMKPEEIIQASSLGEKMASGSAHIDNVTAACLGGFTVVTSRSPVSVFSIQPDQLPNFDVIVSLPDIVIETRKSRAVLPKEIPLDDVVENISLSSSMLHALMRGDLKTVGACLKDRVALPYRKALIPGFEKVQKAAMDAGALGFSLSGAGPAVFAIAEDNAKDIARAMESAFKSSGFKSQTFITTAGPGAEILEVS
ncbi:MAG: homoserine kinase [Methanomassiliicoccales archaeon]